LDPNERWKNKKNKLDCGIGNRTNCGSLWSVKLTKAYRTANGLMLAGPSGRTV
jgi:hypothetical protein